MKQVMKTTEKKAIETLKSQIYYTAAYETGNTRACVTHYCVGNEEVAQISYNFNTKTYIVRM